MSRAFSLVEVILSVIILTTVGLGLLQISNNAKYSMEIVQEDLKDIMPISIAFNHRSKKYDRSNKNLSEFIQGEYDLSDDTIQRLKEIKVDYEYDVIAQNSIMLTDEESFTISEYIVKLTIDNKNYTESGFEIK